MNQSFEKARRNNSLNSDGLWDIVCYIVGCVSGEVVYQNLGMSLLGCIEANFVIKCFFLQYAFEIYKIDAPVHCSKLNIFTKFCSLYCDFVI